MSNYYNIAGWKHTGFNPKNRPLNREVLEKDEFTQNSMYFRVKGLGTNRDDMSSITHIDLQGSVKDYDGEQLNPPNSLGKHGPGGPYYSWEEVDYIRITRTGYEGDHDFVNIAGNPDDPWNAPHAGYKLFIGYYFVTGTTPLARNVTRIHLMFDHWTSLNQGDDLFIESGFKTRGHITEAEDASTFNLSSEGIGLNDVMKVTNYTKALELSGEQVNIITSGSDLTQYTLDDAPSIEGMTAQVEGGAQVVVPYVQVSKPTRFTMYYPPPTNDIIMDGVGAYSIQEGNNVEYNINLLYSAGQLELQDSYSIPKEYVVEAWATQDRAMYASLYGNFVELPNALNIPGSSYPRKADYLYTQAVIMSDATGSANYQPISQLENTDVVIWACPLPGGTPYARFRNIKGSAHPYDQSVMGMAWISKSIALSGASGSFWTNVGNAFSQQTLERNVDKTNHSKNVTRVRQGIEGVNIAAGAAIDVAALGASGVSATNYLSGGKETVMAARALQSNVNSAANLAVDVYDSEVNNRYNQEALDQEARQIAASTAQALWQAPAINFVPSLGSGSFAMNTFSVFVLEPSDTDKQRLKRYFRRYGYSNLYKPLTLENINVKSRVNYIEAEGVSVSHAYYSSRVCNQISAILAGGVFLWNERPKQEAFENNPDN